MRLKKLNEMSPHMSSFYTPEVDQGNTLFHVGYCSDDINVNSMHLMKIFNERYLCGSE